MARITIEDCQKHVPNMYELVHVATRRARQLFRGSNPLIHCKNRVAVTALREIAAGKVKSSLESPNEAGLDELASLTN